MVKPGSYETDDDRSLDLYLREIGEYALLNDSEAKVARQSRLGDLKARHALVCANLRFVVSVAKGYQNQGLSLLDLINEGNVGLMKAAERFDERRGFKFISYAVWWIRQSILQALSEQSRIVRIPLNKSGELHKLNKLSKQLEQKLGREPSPEELAEQLEENSDFVDQLQTISNSHLSLDEPAGNDGSTSLEEVIWDEFSALPGEELEHEQLVLDVQKMLDTLTPRESEVLYLYFGLGFEKELTLEEIGERFSLTRERVRQIKEKGIARLRHASRSRRLRQHLP